MKQFFIYKATTRLTSPIISGTILYMLLLTIFNDISSLLELYFTKELFVCIGLAYLTQEITIAFFKFEKDGSNLIKYSFRIPIVLTIVCAVTAINICLYYKYINGFSPSHFEYIVFLSLFSLLSLIHVAITVSYNLLHQKNLDQLHREENLKRDIERDFMQFKNGINPKLLFESLESLIILSHHDLEEADKLIDQLSTVYRYILSKRRRELIECHEEVIIAEELVKLFNHLPYGSIALKSDDHLETLIVPGTLLFLIELIINKSIKTKLATTLISLTNGDDNIILSFKYKAKLGDQLESMDFDLLNHSYQFYTDNKLSFDKTMGKQSILIPKLNYS